MHWVWVLLICRFPYTWKTYSKISRIPKDSHVQLSLGQCKTLIVSENEKKPEAKDQILKKIFESIFYLIDIIILIVLKCLC